MGGRGQPAQGQHWSIFNLLSAPEKMRCVHVKEEQNHRGWDGMWRRRRETRALLELCGAARTDDGSDEQGWQGGRGHVSEQEPAPRVESQPSVSSY